MRRLPTLKQLEYLTALAHTAHFGRAAERCFVTPSTLSAGIRDLEDTLGVVLAERTKRSVRITPIGAELAARARALLRDAGELVTLARASAEPLHGDLHLGVIPTIGPFLLPRVMPAIHARFAELRLYLRESRTAELLERLHDGDLDAVLLALPYRLEGLATEVLFDDPFEFACTADHPLAGAAAVGHAALADEPLMLLEEGHCLREHALDACALPGAELRTQFAASSLHTLVQMVASGIGVTLLPRLAIRAGITAGTGIRLVPVEGTPARRIGLAWRYASPRGPEMALLAEAMRAAAE